MNDPRLDEATRLLTERSGITVPPYRRPLLAAELVRLGAGDLDRGLDAFRAGDELMIETIAGVFAVGETYLFRGPEHFLELRRLALRAHECGLPFNVLCAGVSTGEEAWSAVLVLAAIYESSNLPYFVVGWDLSSERLQRARLASFGRWSTRSGFMGYERYLVATDNGYEIDPRLRRHAQFEQVNLARPLPAGERIFDAIFFRNVSMYWTRQQASEVAAALGRRLVPGGSLLVGSSDPIELPQQDWRMEMRGSSLIYRRVEGQPASFVFVRPAPARELPATNSTRIPGTRQATQRQRRLPLPPRPIASPAPTDTVDALGERVRELADRGQYEQALSLLAERDPLPPELLELEGIVHFSRGDLDAAIERFRAAVYWAPTVAAYASWLELAIANRARLLESRPVRADTGSSP